MKFPLAILLLLFTLASCSEPVADSTSTDDNTTVPDDCEYELVEATAIVSSIEEQTSNDRSADGKSTAYYHVELSFDASVLSTESQYLEDLLEHPIDQAFLDNNQIVFGKPFKVKVHQLTSSEETCNAYKVSFETSFQ